jgi:hypothetical protein
MFRTSWARIMVVLSLGACSTPPAESARQERQPDAPSAASSPPAAASPAAAPSATVRDIPFDAGVAHVETQADGEEHVILRDASGALLADSHCPGPRQGYDAIRAFFTGVREAILSGDSARAAEFMRYPLRVNGRETRLVRSRQQFIAEHALILSQGVVAQVRAADPGQVFCNAQGSMLGDGVLWAELQPDDRLAVWVINAGAGNVR